MGRPRVALSRSAPGVRVRVRARVRVRQCAEEG